MMARCVHFLVALIAACAICQTSATEEDIQERLRKLELLVQSQQLRADAQAAELRRHKELIQVQQQQLLRKASQENQRHLSGSDDNDEAMDHIWLLLCGSLVMLMQAGFAMVEAGCCRSRNVQSMLLKNLTDVCSGTLGWWVLGWAFAFGGPDVEGTINPDGTISGDGFLDGGFIGRTMFFSSGFLEADDEGVFTVRRSPANWYFQWAFCSVASTIVSGGVAERVQFPAYVLYSIFMTAFIYPVVVAWTWGYGFLAAVTETGYMDFAGSGVVHMTGGVAALVGATIAGPRHGRWERPDEFNPHSLPLVVLGTFLLWFGWYGFNCGSTMELHTAAKGHLAAQVAMNTTISATSAGMATLIIRLVKTRRYEVGSMCNGILAGLVSITASCANVESGSAFVIGLCAALIYTSASSLVRFAKVDDPIDAFAVHGACGTWGVLSAALFDWGEGFTHAHGWSGFKCVARDGKCVDAAWVGLFGANILEIVVIIAWVAGLSVTYFLPMSYAGLLRAPEYIQHEGFDTAKHTPAKAYSFGSLSSASREAW